MSPGEELVHAARELLEHGGSITRRNALRHALNQVELTSTLRGEVPADIPFTPALIQAIKDATRLARTSNDNFVRLQHILDAIKQLECPIARKAVAIRKAIEVEIKDP